MKQIQSKVRTDRSRAIENLLTNVNVNINVLDEI